MPIDEPLKAAIVLPLVFVVTLCAITDVAAHRIPNIVLWPALSLAFLFNSLLAGIPGFVDCVFGLVIGSAMLFPLYFAGGTSAGDTKLLGVVGAFLGAKGAITAGVATFISGGVLGVLFIAWRVIEPVLITHIAQLVRTTGATSAVPIRAVTRESSRNTKFPYAPAIACGTYFSVWQLGYLSQVTG